MNISMFIAFSVFFFYYFLRFKYVEFLKQMVEKL